jgi:hypothetical protein
MFQISKRLKTMNMNMKYNGNPYNYWICSRGDNLALTLFKGYGIKGQ